MKRHDIDKVDEEQLGKYASWRTRTTYSFDVEKILDEVPPKMIAKLKLVNIKNDPFNKLIPLYPKVALLRQIVGIPDQSVVVNDLKKKGDGKKD